MGNNKAFWRIMGIVWVITMLCFAALAVVTIGAYIEVQLLELTH